MMSCGARKVHKEVIETKEEMVLMGMAMDTTMFHRDDTHNTITSTDIETEEVIITPIDSSKDMKVENKTYKNVVIKKSHKKDKTKVEVRDTTKVDSSSSHAERAVSFNIKEGSMSMKSSEKEDGVSFYLYSLLFLLLLILLFYLVSKFKKYFI